MPIETTVPRVSEYDFSLIESFGWRGEYLFFREHLDRLRASASYFGFRYANESVIAALRENERGLDPNQLYKVRLQAEAAGEFRINNEVILPSARPVPEIVIVPVRMSSKDPFRFHKTTHRSIYDRYFVIGRGFGYDEILFLNERDELTECANHNLFVLSAEGRLLTPEILCGLLPGIYRRHMLKTVENSASAVLHIEDLRAAEQIFICNSVRGMRRVTWSSQAFLKL